jgi:FMN phosphatase YigB (HAD superfamily)
VLFDLDGTLLDIDLQGFLRRYFGALRAVPLGAAANGLESGAVVRAIMTATDAMMALHPGRTNLDTFSESFERATGIAFDALWPAYERFYTSVFPLLQGEAGPSPGARRAVETARELGLLVAVATNPIFPRIAVDHRLAWAGLGDVPFDVITTYEHMNACKPHGAYFTQTAAMLGVDPSDCLMVGDDITLDLPASDVGMRTFLKGDARSSADYRGTLDDLAGLLPLLAGV